MSEESAAAALSGDNGGQSAGDAGDAGATGGQSQETSWTSNLDEQTHEYVQAKGWQDPNDLLKSYQNLEKFAGGSKNIVELPGEDADDDTLGNFFSKLGRPESPDQYGLEVPENADEDVVKWFKESAHKHGLTDRQASALFNDWNEMSSERMEQMNQSVQQKQEADVNNLKKEWGQKYDENIGAGRKAVQALGLDQESLSSFEEKLGTADMLKLFANIGSKMGEDSFVTGDRSGSSFGVTPAAAQQQISDLKMDKTFMDKYLNGDKDAVNKLQKLMGAAYGG